MPDEQDQLAGLIPLGRPTNVARAKRMAELYKKFFGVDPWGKNTLVRMGAPLERPIRENSGGLRHFSPNDPETIEMWRRVMSGDPTKIPAASLGASAWTLLPYRDQASLQNSLHKFMGRIDANKILDHKRDALGKASHNVLHRAGIDTLLYGGRSPEYGDLIPKNYGASKPSQVVLTPAQVKKILGKPDPGLEASRKSRSKKAGE
jgi:hypothetical protein